MKKVISMLLILILALGLYSCSAKSNISENQQTMAAMPDLKADTNSTANEDTATDGAEGSLLTDRIASNRKIIYEAHLRLEALDFDNATSSILQQLSQLEGYVSSSSIDGQKGESNRYAEYTIRVPQQNYNKMLTSIAQFTNVLSQSENAQDITSEYVDIEARLKSLRTQEERLLEMMKSAGELETLLAVQNQLADVQYRIESITAQKNTYDTLTQCATINITLDEVSRITETQKDTFLQRIDIAFRQSWISFADSVQGVIIALVYIMPGIIILALLGGVVLFAALKAAKRKKTKQHNATQQPQDMSKAQPQQMPHNDK